MNVQPVSPALTAALQSLKPINPVIGERYLDLRDGERVRVAGLGDLGLVMVESERDKFRYPVPSAEFRNWYRPI